MTQGISSESSVPAPTGWLPWLLLAIGVGVTAWGLLTVDLYSALPKYRFRDLMWFSLAAMLLALAIHRIVRLPGVFAWAMALVVIHVAALGLGQTLVVVFLAVSAWSIGHLCRSDEDDHPAVRIVVGLALLAGLIGWLLPYRVHDRLVYTGLLLLPILWQRRALFDRLMGLPGAARHVVHTVPLRSAGFCLLVLGFVATAAWLPAMMSDDVVYHLGLPAQLIRDGYYHADVRNQVWAMSPWASDVLHAITMMLSGQDEIGALNTLWLLLGATLLWRILSRFGVSAVWSWLGTALCFSVPMYHMAMNSMQTELASTAVVLALVDRIGLPAGTVDRRQILTIAILSSFLLALKVSNVSVVAPALVWWLLRHRPFAWRPLATGVFAGCFVAGSSYLYAYLLTGNPVLPLFNSIFQSPLAPVENFSNPLYVGLLRWDVLYQATFDSSRYMESGDGTFGFQWLACSLLLIGGLVFRPTRAIGLVALFGVVVLFVQMQYLRYLLPALSLLSVVGVVMLAGLRPAWLAKTLVMGIVLFNLHFLCLSAPSLGGGIVTEVVRHGLDAVRTNMLVATAPERLLLGRFGDRLDPHATVLAGTGASVAELASRGTTISWNSADFWTDYAALEADATGTAYVTYFQKLGVDHVILRPEFASQALITALEAQGAVIDVRGAAALYSIVWPGIDLLESPRERLPDRAGLVSTIAVPAGDPLIARITTSLRCGKKGWGVSVTPMAFGTFGEKKLASQMQFCGQDFLLHYDISDAVPEGTTELEVHIRTFTNDNPIDVVAARITLRPDLLRKRDESGKLRLFD